MNDKFTIFLDLDGVLVGFDQGYQRISKGMSFDEYAEKYGDAAATRHFLSIGKNFWEGLPWEHGGKELYEFVRNHFTHIKILSSTGSRDNAKQHAESLKGKLLWIKNNIPDLTENDIIIVSDRNQKQKYASKFGILIDDHPSNIRDWNRAGGYGILHDSRNYKKTINTLEEIVMPLNLSEIVKRLQR